MIRQTNSKERLLGGRREGLGEGKSLMAGGQCKMAERRDELRLEYSVSEATNARYEFGQDSKPMHNIEDKNFVLSTEHSKVFCVLDGHDGANAVEFAHAELKRIFSSKSWETIARGRKREHIVHALKEFFTMVDRLYFDEVRKSIDKKKRIQDMLQVSCRKMYGTVRAF